MGRSRSAYCCCSDTLKAPLSMILVQVFTTVMLLLSKVVLSRGIFVFSLLAYRHAVGALFVAPFALFLERGMWKRLCWKVIFWIFINAMFGISVAMAFYFYGLRDTTAGFSSNFLNLIPIVTFFFAVIARVERVRIGSRGGNVKILGILVSVGGATVVSLYKGRALHIWPSHFIIMHHGLPNEDAQVHHWTRGTLLLLGSCTSYASWFIIQVKLYEVFPSKYWTTMLTCIAGCLQTLVLGIIINRAEDAWRLKWDLQLLTIICTGVFNTGATFCLVSWVIAKRGPIYPSMFNSLSVIFTTILESLFMGQDITIGSLIGTFLIIGGLYAFLWAKGRELLIQAKVGDILPASDDESTSSQFCSKENINVDKDVLLVHIDVHHESDAVVPKESEKKLSESEGQVLGCERQGSGSQDVNKNL